MIIDIFVLFFKPIYIKGVLVVKMYQIALFRITKLNFYCDLLAAYPSVFIKVILMQDLSKDSSEVYSIFYLLKFLKLRYTFMLVDKIFDLLKIQSLSDIRRILKLSISLLIMIHLMGCLNLYISTRLEIERGWSVNIELVRDTSNFELYVSVSKYAHNSCITLLIVMILDGGNDSHNRIWRHGSNHKQRSVIYSPHDSDWFYFLHNYHLSCIKLLHYY